MTERRPAQTMARNMSGDRQFLTASACLFLVGLSMRFYQIDEHQFWLDEALTGYLTVTDDWLHFVHNSPPLYFLLLRGWSTLFGIDEAALRGFSAITSAAAIPLAMYTGRAIFDRNAGLAAGLVMLVSPISIYYAQEARPYALLITELLFVYWMMWRARTGSGRANWVLLALGTAAAIYTHSLSVIPLALGYTLALLRAYQCKQHWHALLYVIAGAAAVCTYLPWLFWWIGTTDFNPSDMAWLQMVWNSYALWRFPADSLLSFYHAAAVDGASVVSKQFFGQPALAGMTLLSVIVLVAMASVLIYGTVIGKDERADTMSLALLLFVPLLTLLSVSFVKPVYLAGRYDLIAYPAFVLLGGCALSRLHDLLASQEKRLMFFVLLAISMIPPGIRALQFYDSGSSRTSESTARYIDSRAGEQDLVLMVEGAGIRTVYYLQLLGYEWRNRQCTSAAQQRQFPCRFLPLNLESAPAAIMRYQQAVQIQSLPGDVKSVVQNGGFDNIYLVVNRLDASGQSIVLNDALSSVLATIQQLGYRITGVQAEENLLHFRSE